MNISLAIVCFNEKDNITQCLDSIKRQTFPSGEYELVVVDNNSTDHTRDILQQYAEDFPIPLRIIINPIPGIAASRNVALQEARFEKVLFIDADCIAPDDWVIRYVNMWVDEGEGHRIVAAGGGNVAPASGNVFQRSLGIMLNSVLGSRGSVQGKLFERPTVIDHHPGLNLLLDKSAALEIGGFDEEKYNFMGEDQDLSLRLNARGYKYLFVPDNAVEHKLRSNWRKWSKNMYDYGKGRALLLREHPHTQGWIFLSIKLFTPLMILSCGLALAVAIRGWAIWPVVILPVVIYLLLISLYSLGLCLKHKRIGMIGHVIRNFLVTHYFYSLGLNESRVGHVFIKTIRFAQ